MKVLVTGAGGYVGRAVVDALAGAGHEPVALLHARPAEMPAGVEVRHADLLDRSALIDALAGIDAVCHLAGKTRARESWEHAVEYFRVNTGGTVELLAATERAGVDRLVFASTASVYEVSEEQPMAEDLPDSPPHPYAASKLAAESAIDWQARTGRMGAVVIRLFNVAGGADPDPTRIVPRVLAAAASGTVLRVNGDGRAIRDYVHVQDAARAFVTAVERVPTGGGARRYNVGSGHGVSVMEVVAAAERSTGRSIHVSHGPPADEPQALVCDPSRAFQELNWEPSRSGLDAVIDDAWLATARPSDSR